VVPGVSVAGVTLGATPVGVREVLGLPAKRISFAEEKALWENFGYDLNKELPFVLGFDEMWTYLPAPGAAQIPVWKVYFKDGKANFIVVSDFVFANARAAVKGGYGLGSSSADIRKAFPAGSAYNDPGGSENLVYDNRGVTFVLKESRVRVIQVYRPR
jgi:hypothetical protein